MMESPLGSNQPINILEQSNQPIEPSTYTSAVIEAQQFGSIGRSNFEWPLIGRSRDRYHPARLNDSSIESDPRDPNRIHKHTQFVQF